jgi:hypothetical protein
LVNGFKIERVKSVPSKDATESPNDAIHLR